MNVQKITDLVILAQNGDQGALNSLFNATYNDIYYFALKTVKDENLACDVTQDTFVEIIKHINELKEPNAFMGWAKKIAYSRCTRFFAKKKEVLVEEDEDGNSIFDTVAEEKEEFIPDAALEQTEFKLAIHGILNELSEEQRSAIMMYYFDEMSVREIAEIQMVSEGTVKSRLNYARKAIKDGVEDYEKKHNVKLHAIPFFPFFDWLFKGESEGAGASQMPLAASNIQAATGVPLQAAGSAAAGTASVAAAEASAAGATAAAETAAIATAVAAKAGISLGAKIIAGIVAAAITIGGGVVAYNYLSDDSEESYENDNDSEVVTAEERIKQLEDMTTQMYGFTNQSFSNDDVTAPFVQGFTLYQYANDKNLESYHSFDAENQIHRYDFPASEFESRAKSFFVVDRDMLTEFKAGSVLEYVSEKGSSCYRFASGYDLSEAANEKIYQAKYVKHTIDGDIISVYCAIAGDPCDIEESDIEYMDYVSVPNHPKYDAQTFELLAFVKADFITDTDGELKYYSSDLCSYDTIQRVEGDPIDTLKDVGIQGVTSDNQAGNPIYLTITDEFINGLVAATITDFDGFVDNNGFTYTFKASADEFEKAALKIMDDSPDVIYDSDELLSRLRQSKYYSDGYYYYTVTYEDYLKQK